MTRKLKSAPLDDLDRFTIIGLGHRTAPNELREAVFVSDDEVPSAARALRGIGARESLIVSTCDRVEVAGLFDDIDTARGAVAETLANAAGLASQDVLSHVYQHTGRAAIHHLFRVAASLDSQVVGEPDVLGQLRASHRLARLAEATGPFLEPVIQAAFAAAKRVRSETHIAEGPVSIVAAATRLARDIHGELDDVRAVLYGVGEMGALLVRQMAENGLRDTTVIDASLSRARRLAVDLNAHYAPSEKLLDTLVTADVLVTAVGEGQYTLNEEMVRETVRRRRRRPMLIVDLGVPADIDPGVDRIEEAFLYDLEDLERVAVEGRASRTAAARAAEAIVETEVARFIEERSQRSASPLITDLRQQFESERMRLHAEQPGLSGEDATHLLLARLLHQPSERLRYLAGEERLSALDEDLLRLVFGLIDSDDPDSDPTGGS